jgi:hemoglobin
VTDPQARAGGRPTATNYDAVAPDPTTMYARLGGGPVIRRIVDRLYSRIFADTELYLRYFAHVDKPTLKAHMAMLLTDVFGGPKQYTGRDLRSAHAHLRDSQGRPVRVTPADFRKVGQYVLGAVLLENPDDDIAAAVPVVLASKAADVMQLPEQSEQPWTGNGR